MTAVEGTNAAEARTRRSTTGCGPHFVFGPRPGNRRKGHTMRRIILTAAALLLGTAVTASAQKPKYTRTTQVKVNVKLNERTRPLVAKEEKKQALPELSADEILQVEGAVGEIREDQIQLLQALIEETPDSEIDEKADLYFRVAEAYAQQQRYHRLKTQEYAIKADTAKKDGEKKEA